MEGQNDYKWWNGIKEHGRNSHGETKEKYKNSYWASPEYKSKILLLHQPSDITSSEKRTEQEEHLYETHLLSCFCTCSRCCVRLVS
jgi:hypothetical protein